ncbi:MAG: 2-(1,2-epoxy-1,2-dihydrophenyl)acetyl-CoA isomerase PaaG [Bacteroidia bacterium]|nr:2-(1,2-epoxy-1,2-dihydrophenyl)acetyl-CoA isomerase PaaG [Bacteroidia bacterium]
MSILKELNNGVLTLTFNRPDVLNSINRETALSLQEALDEASNNKEVRAVLITGSGRGFCAGQDLAEATDPSAKIDTFVREHYNPIVLKIRSIEKPVIAAVNGVAAGAGANLAFCCDLVFAGKSSSFIQSFVNIGLIPDSGGTFFLPRIIGMQKATALMFTGEKISSEEAERLGLIYKVVDDTELLNEAFKLAARLAQMPTAGIGYTKRLLNASYNNDLKEQLDMEEEMQLKAGNSYDYSEGVRAFLEKRKPVFKGE